MPRHKKQILLYGNTRNCADIFYFVGASVHDDFFCFTIGNKKCALLSPLEVDRIRRKSKLDIIFDYAEVTKAMPKKSTKSYLDATVWLLKQNKVRSIEVPSYFPIGVYENLLQRGLNLYFNDGEFFAERAIKTNDELAEIRKANDVASECFAWLEETLRKSTISNDGKLRLKNEILTSEFLRTGVEKIALEMRADALDTVVACANQACDPHEVGSGAIYPHSLIVADIFPRLRQSGYFGDMTRTFLKGTPNKQQEKIVNTVRYAQLDALKIIRAGVNGASVHSRVCEKFVEAGFETKIVKGHWNGFFHSTGHGLGLEVHEAPSLGTRDCTLQAGNVVTVEPGLYYRGVGGCRIEDNVVVKKDGAKLLSNFHYNWIID